MGERSRRQPFIDGALSRKAQKEGGGEKKPEHRSFRGLGSVRKKKKGGKKTSPAHLESLLMSEKKEGKGAGVFQACPAPRCPLIEKKKSRDEPSPPDKEKKEKGGKKEKRCSTSCGARPTAQIHHLKKEKKRKKGEKGGKKGEKGGVSRRILRLADPLSEKRKKEKREGESRFRC